ncbi:hypothetical protein ACQKQC_06140 [Vibrio fortis]|uniref:hypothetical protein n=1 Tax=Vibrio fortis TaxID=212667 RepID=UPI004067D0C9
MHKALFGLPFKKGTKAVAFKFDSVMNKDGTALDIVMAYSDVDIVSGGKVRIRYAYDGSLFEEQFINKISGTIDYYGVDPSEHRPTCENNWRLGDWLLIPHASVTDEKPIDFWIDVAKYEFIQKLALMNYPPEIFKAVEANIADKEVKRLSVSEWNEARLSIIDKDTREYFTTK